MKRILTLALLASTALATPAMAASVSLGGGGSSNSSTTSSGTIGGAKVGADVGVGADIGVGADSRTNASSNNSASSSTNNANTGISNSTTSNTGASINSNVNSGFNSNVNSGLDAETQPRINSQSPLDANAQARLNEEKRENIDAQINENVDTQIRTPETPIRTETGANSGVTTYTATGDTSVGGTAVGTANAAQGVRAETLNNADVKLIQQSLRQEGLFKGTADGKWGPQTASALQQFQQKNQIGANGTLDAQTLNELGVQLGTSARTGVGSSVNSGTTNN